MKNVIIEIHKDELTIRVNLKQDLGPSSTGKTRIIASSCGNAEIPGHPGVQLGLNIFRKA